MGLRETAYLIVAYLIQTYKSAELKLFELFSAPIERRVRNIYAKAGVVFEIDSDNDKSSGNNNTDLEHIATNSEFKDIIRVRVHDRSFFTRVANYASLGFGESYMLAIWDCDRMAELCFRILRKKIFLEYLHPWNRFINYMQMKFFNLQTESKAWEVGRKHYDLGNDLFESFLDPWLTYSCGYWKSADNLNDAQVHKMELIAKKLDLKPGMRVLDIGCGWGGMCKFLSKYYGVECVGITISEEGAKYGKKSCEGLPVDIRLADYRDLNEQFDRIVSIGMFEHVGGHNYRTYFKVARRCLKDDGIFLLHTIGISHQDMVSVEPWYHTYIFPNGYLPSNCEITEKSEGLFIIEDWHNFGPDYANTLLAWLDNFNKNWPNISLKYGNQFYRMWTYYLQISAAGFQARTLQLWQIVLSKDGLENYRAAR